jgi:DNA primase
VKNELQMGFDQGAIREIHTRLSIADVIGAHVQLRKRGNDLVGLCPFHGEKTPSFHVHPDRGFFKCFGCGVGGDVIAFVQKIENLSFPDTVRMLAAKAGVELEPEDPRISRARNLREAIYEANQIAVAFFVRSFRSEGGAKARAYCAERGLSAGTLDAFQLGYAPDSWDALRDELQANHVDLEVAARAGLLKPGQRGYYDFYRDRLMIPTFSTTGEPIAFGGRALGDAEPKYLNTTTTPAYTKGRHLYALNVARRAAARERTLIVVEGYLDCIALHQAGIDNAVAALGTSFTEEQAGELRKYADNVFLCFDGDTAGTNAATKAVDIASNVLEHAGSAVRIVILPEGQDPDSYVRAHGAEGFRALLAAAKSAVEFKLDPQIDRLQGGFASPATIARSAERLIRELTSREEWDRWRVYVAGRLKVNPDDLRNSRFFSNSANFAPRTGAIGNTGSRHAPIDVEPLSFEREVLSIVVEEPLLAAEFAHRIEPTRFRSEPYRRIYERIVEQAGGLRDTGDIFTLFADDEESLAVVAELGRRDRSGTTRYEEADGRREHLERIVDRLKLDSERQRYQELSHRIDDLVTTGQPISDALRGEYDALVTKLKK